MNEEIQTYFNNLNTWCQELRLLHDIIVECDLDQTFKWKQPCYTFNNSNIVLIGSFKNYCALLFMNGSLINDPEKKLIKPTENSQYGRQLRFTSVAEIIKNKKLIQTYINRAVEVEKEGKKVQKKQTSAYEVPEELLEAFTTDAPFKIAYDKLTEGRKRGYLLHFLKPKKKETRISLIEKNKNRIFDGYGLYDCTCGMSKKMPTCDGSHKQIKS